MTLGKPSRLYLRQRIHEARDWARQEAEEPLCFGLVASVLIGCFACAALGHGIGP